MKKRYKILLIAISLLLCYKIDNWNNPPIEYGKGPNPPIDTTRELKGYNYQKHIWIYKEENVPIPQTKTYTQDTTLIEMLRELIIHEK